MRKLIISVAVIGLIALTPRSEAKPSEILPPVAIAETETPQGISELGVASWYGEDFQGNPTASGEVYDMNGLTAAHRELPLCTIIKVTNLRNNRSIIVKVNDRGPFVTGRFLDLSMEGAKQLGFMAAGLALVEIEIVKYPKWYLEAHASRAPETRLLGN